MGLAETFNPNGAIGYAPPVRDTDIRMAGDAPVTPLDVLVERFGSFGRTAGPAAAPVPAAGGSGSLRKAWDRGVLAQLSPSAGWYGPSTASAFNAQARPPVQQQPQQQSGLIERLNTDPVFAQNFVHAVKAIAAAQEQKPSINVRTDTALIPQADARRIDEHNQANYARADDAVQAVNFLKEERRNMKEQPSMAGPSRQFQGYAAAPAPQNDAATRIAAQGMGSESSVRHIVSAFQNAQDPAAPLPVSSGPGQETEQFKPNTQMILTGPGLEDVRGKVTLAVDANGAVDNSMDGLRINGMGLDRADAQLSRTFDLARIAAEGMDRLAQKGVAVDLGTAAGLADNAATFDRVADTGMVTVRQVNRPSGPGMSA